MKLSELGFNEFFEQHRTEHDLISLEVGRITLEHKERYIVKTQEKDLDAELLGNLRFSAASRYDFPAVGDWVALSEYDEGKALIHAIYPRQSIIERKAVGSSAKIQIMATNIDYGLIVQAVDRDFNLNRLERYLTICHSAKVKPIIVLSKIDLIEASELEEMLDQVKNRMKEIPLVTVSNQTIGYDRIDALIKKGKTYCLLGSSGVGKSTLLNNLLDEEIMKTGPISTSVNKGKHVTSHRELIVLKNGGILIDNPGMREVGIADYGEGLDTTFQSIMDFASQCKFRDCTHIHEKGCAVIAAINSGEIDRSAYNNFHKMEKEKSHFQASALDRRRSDKKFGKMIKQVIQDKKKNKF